MAATARIGVAHWEVAYNENRQPLLISRYDRLGLVTGYELQVYDSINRLERRGELDSANTIVSLIWFGENEPWSSAYRAYAIDTDDNLGFQGQSSKFTFAANGRINSVVFRSIDGHRYGRIEFEYDQSGRLLMERWISLPASRTVRSYSYRWDQPQGSLQLQEYGRTGKMVSHVSLSQAPADQLYRVPPPLTGNILDEVDIILDEINQQKNQLSFPAIIPRTEWDRIVLKTGEIMDVQVVEVRGTVARFRRPGESDDLSIPLERVQVVLSRYGERLYP